MNRTPDIIADLRNEIDAAPPADRPRILGQLAALVVEAMMSAALPITEPPADNHQEINADRLLTAEQAAEMLGQKSSWVRAHAHQLPRVPLPGRTLRFSEKRLVGYIRAKGYG